MLHSEYWSAALFYAALQYNLWRPDMKQAAVAAVHGQVFSEVRGKYTARICDSDMNTVYLTGVCVYIDFPLRPLSEPGWRPSEGLRAWQTCLSCVVVSPLDSHLVKHKPCQLSYNICIPKKHNTIDFEF